jgi:hypothetical protein
MTLQEFIEKYKGKKVDFDGVYGAQCVDLVRQYWKEVWQIQQPESVGGAQEFVTRYKEKPILQKYIELAPRGVSPLPGDIVVFGSSSTNKYGHIAIFIDWVRGGMEVFEQDGFKQDGAKTAFWTTDRVIGCLRKRE